MKHVEATQHVPWPKEKRAKARRSSSMKRAVATSAKSVLRLLLYIASADGTEGLTIPEIQKRCGCARRQAYRYLDALKDVGVPIITDPAGWGVRRKHRLGNVNLAAWSLSDTLR